MLIHGDCIDVFNDVRGLASIVSDPPGGGSFMGLKFDHHKGGRDKWIAAMAARFRVAREATERGAWGLFWSFGLTAHWTPCALDDAGWQYVRPIGHLHGQGWPKARSQLKPAWEIWHLVRWGTGGVRDLQIDRCRVRRSESTARPGGPAGLIYGDPGPAGLTRGGDPGGSWPPDVVLSHAGCCREVGTRKVRGSGVASGPTLTGPSTPLTRGQFNGTNKPPAFYGSEQEVPAWECLAACTCGLASLSLAGGDPAPCPGCGSERWWACPVAELVQGQTDKLRDGRPEGHDDSGGASRFYPTFRYDAKASDYERQAGCEHLLWIRDKDAPIGWRRVDQAEYDAAPEITYSKQGKPTANRARGNVHATIKPIGAGDDDGLMRWLVRLVTPPGGRIGDPFLGSGSTAVAAQLEGHPFIGCDIDAGAVDIARARTAFWTPERHREELLGITARREAARKKAEEERAAIEARGQRGFGW